MKALTLWQPWASLWVAGIKKNETRSWATSHRGPLVVHAARLTARQLRGHISVAEYFRLSDVCGDTLGVLIGDLPHGCIVGTVDVVGCYQVEDCSFSDGSIGPSWQVNDSPERDWPGVLERALGDYSPGRYAWISAHHRAIDPIPCRGRQGLWAVSSIEAAVLAGEGVAS